MRMSPKWMPATAASVLTLAVAMPVSAQTPQAPDQASASNGLEEIVVTARRREEKAQTVPIVMDVFTPQALAAQDIRQAQDLSHDVPGLSIVSSYRGYATSVFLRGVPGVITYFAEVPTTLTGGAYYFDLDNVQALKGPQGTLFGLNADAGAILFEPKKPTGTFEGYGQVTVGDYNRHEFQGAINIPVVTDKLNVRAGLDYNHIDGFQYDQSEKQYVNDEDYWIGRLSATLTPVDGVSNYVMANYYYSQTNGGDLFPNGVNPKGYAALVFPAVKTAFAQQQALGPYMSLGSTIPGGMVYSIGQWNVSDITTVDVSDAITFKNIAGYTEISTYSRLNFAGTPYPIYQIGVGSTPQGPLATYSDETQLQGKSFDENLTWVVGSFLSYNHQTDPQPQYNVALGSRSGTISATSGRTQAIYTQGTYDLSSVVEGLKFTAGYRYTWDWRSAFQNSLNSVGKTLLVYAADGQFHAPGYTFSLDYQVNPGTMVYLNYSKAYSSGGFNLTSPVQLQKYNPEYLSDLEAGVKSDWELGGIKGRTNFGGFYGWYDDIQAPSVLSYTDATGIHLATVTTNAATAHIEGLESEFTLIPLDGLELTGNAILMDAHFDHYVSNGTDLSGTPFYYLPPFKYSVSGRYHFALPGDLGDLSFTAAYTWQKHLLKSNDYPPVSYLPSFGNLDLDIDWTGIAGQPVDAAFYMTNVTDNAVNMGGFGAYNALGLAAVGVAPPRMFGFKFKYHF
jgi:iron complex outermembrane receptor protein